MPLNISSTLFLVIFNISLHIFLLYFGEAGLRPLLVPSGRGWHIMRFDVIVQNGLWWSTMLQIMLGCTIMLVISSIILLLDHQGIIVLFWDKKAFFNIIAICVCYWAKTVKFLAILYLYADVASALSSGSVYSYYARPLKPLFCGKRVDATLFVV